MRRRSSNRSRNHPAGFTLVEAAVATAIVGMAIAAVGYGSGVSARNIREERRGFQRSLLLTSKMTELDATPYASLASGADTVQVDGSQFVRNWQISRADGNGDGNADGGLLRVLVWVDLDTCRTLRGDLP